MPRYLSQHTLACLTRQDVAELVRQLWASTNIRGRRILLNMQEGKLLVEIEASDRAELEKWFVGQKVHFDWILRIEFESVDGDLHSVF